MIDVVMKNLMIQVNVSKVDEMKVYFLSFS